MVYKLIPLLFLISLLSACFRSAEPVTIYQSNIHLTKPFKEDGNAYTNYKDYLSDDNGGKEYDGKFYEWYQSITQPNDDTAAQAYVNRGINYSRLACAKYLDDLSSNDNKLGFGRDEFNVAVVLATGLLGINGASSDTFSRLALGTAAVNSSIELYQNYFLLGPDSDVIVKLVKDTMKEMVDEIQENPATTFDQAYAYLYSYSDVCSSRNIRYMVREAIKNAKVKIVGAEVDDAAAEAIWNEIADVTKQVGLSYNNRLGIYGYYKLNPDPGVNQNVDGAIVTLLAPLEKDNFFDQTKNELTDPGKKVRELLSKLPAKTKRAYDDELESLVDTANTSGFASSALPIAVQPISKSASGVLRVEIQ